MSRENHDSRGFNKGMDMTPSALSPTVEPQDTSFPQVMPSRKVERVAIQERVSMVADQRTEKITHGEDPGSPPKGLRG